MLDGVGAPVRHTPRDRGSRIKPATAPAPVPVAMQVTEEPAVEAAAVEVTTVAAPALVAARKASPIAIKPAGSRPVAEKTVDGKTVDMKNGEVKIIDAQPVLGHGADAKPIDMTHLSRFTFGDRGLEKEILALFVNQAPQLADALRDAPRGDAWRMAAHTLKGSARAVGAGRIARAAEAAETLSFDDDAAKAVGLGELDAAIIEAATFIAGL